MRRADVVLVDFPYTSGLQTKVRPAVVVQNDRDNQRLTKTVVAMVTGNVRRAAEPTHLTINPAIPEHAASGLRTKSLVVCVNLFTIRAVERHTYDRATQRYNTRSTQRLPARGARVAVRFAAAPTGPCARRAVIGRLRH